VTQVDPTRRVRVATEPPYEVRIGRGVLRGLAEETARFTRLAVLTDDVVGPLHFAKLAELRAPSLAVPSGEGSKRFASLERVLEFLAQSDLDRGSCLVALGGGVVGDLGGLAASLYMRGIACVQAPTTLLAQVDASVGGKTAVDLEAGKNLAGTFHQPAAVFADTETLATLPEVEIRSGLGEVVKSALIEGEEALAALERAAPAIRARELGVFDAIVERCVRLKAEIVRRDPRETGERKTLNLGHTFAHAIERAAGYGRIPHGIAVAVGISMALRGSRVCGRLEDEALPARIDRLFEDLGLPGGDLPDLPGTAEILAAMRHDKKGSTGKPRFVLPRSAGNIEFDVAIDAERLVPILERVRGGLERA
jgi:3-dehydroquinate synthase